MDKPCLCACLLYITVGHAIRDCVAALHLRQPDVRGRGVQRNL